MSLDLGGGRLYGRMSYARSVFFLLRVSLLRVNGFLFTPLSNQERGRPLSLISLTPDLWSLTIFFRVCVQCEASVPVLAVVGC